MSGSQQTRVDAALCEGCNIVVFSRATHDFRSCKCKLIAIDGGRDYTRYIGSIDMMHILVLELPSHIQHYDLYNDYADQTNKLGFFRLEDLHELGYKVIEDCE